MLAKNTRLKLIFMKKSVQKKHPGKKHKAINDSFCEKYTTVFSSVRLLGAKNRVFDPLRG